VPDAAAAADLINCCGIATVYPTSTEVANLFHAHVGDPKAKTENKWDSPSGRVYSWRWEIGRKGSAFYGTVVRKRPTFVMWSLLPAILRLMGDLRTPDELFDFGIISNNAYKIARVLDGSREPLGTSDIRRQAGFPMGRDNSAAYHKGLAELENRLLVTSEFVAQEGEATKHHGLMFERRRADVDAASAMTIEQAVDTLLEGYIPSAAYIRPAVLAKDLRIEEPDISAGVERLVTSGKLEPATAPGLNGSCYVISGQVG